MNEPERHRDRPLAKKVLRNTAFNIIGKFWGLAVGLFLTPYILSSIGPERYGIWALVSVVTGYFGLLDFGIGSSYVKYIAEYYTRKDFRGINSVVNSGLLFYAVFSLFLLLAAWPLFPVIFSLLRISPEFLPEATFVFWAGLATFCISNAASIFAAIQNGLQRMELYNKISVFISLPGAAGTVLALKYGYGLRGLILVNAASMALAGAANFYFAKKLLPELRLSPGHLSLATFRRLLGYGMKLQIARVSSAVSMQIDKLLLTRYLDLTSVALFQLGASVIEQAKSIPLLLMNALLPAFSELDARGDRAGIVDAYIRGTKYIAILTVPFFTLIAVAAPELMRAWMGEGYGRSALIVRILAAGWGLAVIAGVRGTVLQAIGEPGIEMRTGLVAAVLNIPLSVIFLFRYGYSGVAMGTTIALAASAVYGFERLNRELNIKSGFYIMTFIPHLSAASALGGAAALAAAAAMGLPGQAGRLGALSALMTISAVFSVVFLAVLAFIKPLDLRDAGFLAHAVPGKLAWTIRPFVKGQE